MRKHFLIVCLPIAFTGVLKSPFVISIFEANAIY